MRTGGAHRAGLIVALVAALASCASHRGDADDLFDTDDEGEIITDGGIWGDETSDAASVPDDGSAGDGPVDSAVPPDAGADADGDGEAEGPADSGLDVDSEGGEGSIEDGGEGGSGAPTLDEEVGKECSKSAECEHIPGYEGHGGFCNEVSACSAYCAKHEDCGCPPGTTTDDIAGGACAAVCTGDGFPRCHRLCATDDDCEGRERCRTWMTDIPFCQ